MILSLQRSIFSILLLMTLMVTTFTPVWTQAADAGNNSRNLSKQINALLQAGNHDEALPLIRELNAKYPGNTRILYNLACAENATGNTTAALAALKQATAAGFSDFRQVQEDPDLKSLAG